jgi:hypothetical protein
MDYDGILYVSKWENGYLDIYVNGIIIARDRKDGSYGSGATVTINIMKQDSIYVDTRATDVYARFYKLRDYSNR